MLAIDTDEDPPLVPYTAAYSLDASTNSSYQIWLAATPPSDASTVSYNVDDGPYTPVNAEGGKISPYSPGLAWYKICNGKPFPGQAYSEAESRHPPLSGQQILFRNRRCGIQPERVHTQRSSKAVLMRGALQSFGKSRNNGDPRDYLALLFFGAGAGSFSSGNFRSALLSWSTALAQSLPICRAEMGSRSATFAEAALA